MGERRPSWWWGVAAVVLLAFALRLGPLYWSPLPFNPDGVGYAARARATVQSGQLPMAEMATDSIGFTGLLSLVSALAGQSPLLVAQPTSAAIGALSVVVGIAIARRLGASIGWPAGRQRQAALVAGLLLAIEGLYLYRSMPTDEQTAGLLLVPAVVLAADRWLRTRRPAWAGLAVVLGVPLAPLHNLSGLVGALGVTCVLGVHLVRTPTRGMAGRTLVVGVLVWVYTLGYHVAVAAWTPAVIVQADRLVRVPGLFVAWVVASVLGGAWYVTTTDRRQRGAVVSVVVVGFGLLAANAAVAVYPGTTTTSTGLLVALLPLAVPALLAGLVAPRAAADEVVGATLVGLVAGALALVGVAFTATLSFPYLAMAYRAQLFVHVPFLALAGLAVVGVAAKADRGVVRSTTLVVVVVSAGASAPVAYSGLEHLTYKGVTTEAEFAATEYAATHFAGWATDDHLARVAGYHGGGGSRGPTYRWLRLGAPPPSCPVLAQLSWTTTGAQFHPQQPAALSERRYRNWKDRNDAVYVVVADDPLVVVLPRGGRTAGCAPVAAPERAG